MRTIKNACNLIEHGALATSVSSIVFSDGKVFAFDGCTQYQAPSPLPPDEPAFAVSEKRLASALVSSGEYAVTCSTTKEFLRLSNGPLTVKVRKLPADTSFFSTIRINRKRAVKADGLMSALCQVQPFISTDASRSWSVAVLLKEGYAYATNNLALVRIPVPESLLSKTKGELRIPLQAVRFLVDIDAQVDLMEVDEKSGAITLQCGDDLMQFPQSPSEWPAVKDMFLKAPKRVPAVPPSLLLAASRIGRFSDRFISMNSESLEGKAESMESEYEVQFSKAKGRYSARLLTLILEHATHADFSFYPEPVFFKNEESGLEGTAVGVREE